MTLPNTCVFAVLAGTVAMMTGLFGKWMSQHEFLSTFWILFLLGNIICTVIMLGLHSKAFYYSHVEHFSTGTVILLNSTTNFIETGLMEMLVLPLFTKEDKTISFPIWCIGITFILIGLHFILKSDATRKKLTQ